MLLTMHMIPESTAFIIARNSDQPGMVFYRNFPLLFGIRKKK